MCIKTVLYENGEFIGESMISGPRGFQQLLINLKHMDADLEILSNGVIAASYVNQAGGDAELHIIPLSNKENGGEL